MISLAEGIRPAQRAALRAILVRAVRRSVIAGLPVEDAVDVLRDLTESESDALSNSRRHT